MASKRKVAISDYHMTTTLGTGKFKAKVAKALTGEGGGSPHLLVLSVLALKQLLIYVLHQVPSVVSCWLNTRRQVITLP